MLLREFKGILLCIFAVEAYTASWIEMPDGDTGETACQVEAYTASWIEISVVSIKAFLMASRLMLPRGLK